MTCNETCQVSVDDKGSSAWCNTALTSTCKHSLDRLLPSPAAFDPTSDDAANDGLSCTIKRLADSYRLPLLSSRRPAKHFIPNNARTACSPPLMASARRMTPFILLDISGWTIFSLRTCSDRLYHHGTSNFKMAGLLFNSCNGDCSNPALQHLELSTLHRFVRVVGLKIDVEHGGGSPFDG